MDAIHTENFIADKPISSQDEDVFQRYNFAKRIAETVIRRGSKESIVYGLFGAWGEGKTSVINFIKQEISKEQENYIQIVFNPWRFTDEGALLTSFFNTLASEIKKNISDNSIPEKKKNWLQKKYQNLTKPEHEPLKTSWENIGDLIQKYGKIAAIFSAGEAAETIGKAISNVDLDKLKARIENLLEESKKRIVIYIDDIDRLDKTEIHSIFRLVKLTGDFSYTSYVLSFDQEMVASAIGERFGSGDKKAGESFLEKIIQVPLNLPKAQPDALKKFCFNLIDNALISNNINLQEEEVQRFVYQFTTNVLPKLNTPRLAVRYGNTLSFTTPLLKGEVNMVDLMLIEALRVFYPAYYYFIKENARYFVSPYTNTYDAAPDKNKKSEIREHLDRLGKGLPIHVINNLNSLLSNLFPILDSVFNNYSFSNESYNEWYLHKRIGSAKYFDRYFSYAVIEGDISDIEFDNFLNKLESGEHIDDLTEFIKKVLEKTSADNFIQKIRSHEQELDWKASKLLSKALCNISELLPTEGGLLNMGFETPFGQAAIFIYQICKRNKSESELFEFAKELMLYPKQFAFAYKINNWLRAGDKPEDKLFNNEQYQELAQILTERAVLEAGDATIFEKFPEYVSYFSHTWAEKDKLSYDEYVKSFIDKAPRNIITLVKTFIPMIKSTIKPEPYKGDLTKERYSALISFFDKDWLLEKITSVFPLDEITKGEQYWGEDYGNDFSELNMARQFLFWYRQGDNLK